MYCIQLWGSQYRKHMELVEHIQRKITKRIRGLEHFYEERLSGLELFSLEKRGVMGRPYCDLSILKGSL